MNRFQKLSLLFIFAFVLLFFVNSKSFASSETHVININNQTYTITFDITDFPSPSSNYKYSNYILFFDIDSSTGNPEYLSLYQSEGRFSFIETIEYIHNYTGAKYPRSYFNCGYHCREYRFYINENNLFLTPSAAYDSVYHNNTSKMLTTSLDYFVASDSPILDSNGAVVFPVAPTEPEPEEPEIQEPEIQEEITLSQIATSMDFSQVLAEVLAILPVVLVAVIGVLSLMKAIHLLFQVLRNS